MRCRREQRGQVRRPLVRHAALVALIAFVVCAAACSDSRSGGRGATAELLEARWSTQARRFASASTGFERLTDEGLRVRRSPVRATLPARANGALELMLPVGGTGTKVRVLRVGATPVRGVLDRGMVVYADGHVDALVFGTKEGIEELLVVHDEVASIAYDVELPGGYALAETPSGTVDVVDGAGHPQLRVTAPRGWDGEGREIALELRAHGRRLELVVPRDAPLPLLLDPLWKPTSTLALARSHHTATLLPSGSILIAGGKDGPTPKGTTELYDPQTGRFTSGARMTVPRLDHTATLLRTGLVLLAGGTGSGAAGKSVELYDPADGTFTAGPAMAVARRGHTATLLDDGRVLLAGGADTVPDRVEIFDPASRTFTTFSALLAPRRSHTETRLVSGEVLLAGGMTTNGLSPDPLAEIFDPLTGQLRAAPSAASLAPRSGHTATLVGGGRVFLASGSNPAGGVLTSGDVYDPATGNVVNVVLGYRHEHAAVLLPSGFVLLAGGNDNGVDGAGAVELFDVAAGASTSGATLDENRLSFTATLLPGGDVALIGGDSLGVSVGAGGRQLDSLELFDADRGLLGADAILPGAASGAKAAALLDGTVVISGGFGLPDRTASLDVYDPFTNAFVSHGQMTTGRTGHTATPLGAGGILLAGGGDAQSQIAFDSAEIFDGVVSKLTGKMVTARSDHFAVRLTSGKVLLGGGTGAAGQTAELYDPATRSFTATASMTTARAIAKAVLLATGEVLVSGGNDASGKAQDSAETYDPRTGQFTATEPMAVARQNHAVALLGSGKVLVAGGATASAELYDPSTRKFALTGGPMITPRLNLAATLLPSGKVLLLGGTYNSTPFPDELYDPKIDRFTLVTNSKLGFVGSATILLRTGAVFAAGGASQGRAFGTAACSLWTADRVDRTRPPLLSPVAPGATAGSTVDIAGSRFTGAEEASGGGSASSPTDMPVAIWMPAAGGILTGTLTPWTSSTATWRIPPSALTGPGMLFLATNGVLSQAAMLEVLPGVGGAACTHDLDCASTHCADGVCCDTSCDAPCMACSAKKLGGGSDGTCRPVPVKGDPDAECLVQDATTCGRSGGCNGAGACATYTDGTTCAPAATCTKGVCTTFSTCVDDATARGADGTSHACAPFVCRDGACIERCTSTSDCAAGLQCSASGDCAAPLADDGGPAGCLCELGAPGGSRGKTSTPLLLVALALGAMSLRRRSAS